MIFRQIAVIHELYHRCNHAMSLSFKHSPVFLPHPPSADEICNTAISSKSGEVVEQTKHSSSDVCVMANPVVAAQQDDVQHEVCTGQDEHWNRHRDEHE